MVSSVRINKYGVAALLFLLLVVTYMKKSLQYHAALKTTGARFLLMFEQAEREHRLPSGLLSRVAFQESSFNPRAVSPAGAQGLMQIVPKWHPDVDPWNESEAIDYAGRYLRELFDEFGNWKLALAAYNWGPGNLRKHGYAERPSETRHYVNEIAFDVTGV